MELPLKEYQVDAVRDVLANLRKCRSWWHADNDRSAFALSAPTAAGKTVIAAAVIEALFLGDDDFGVQADPGAVVVWLSDDPSLNAQSLHRIDQCADRLDRKNLKVVESTFNQERFTPGNVYFLNTQKLGRNSLLTRGQDDSDARLPDIRPDGRDHTIWDTIQNTIDDDALTLYLILDEAHRGVGSTSSGYKRTKTTIVRRLLDGDRTVAPLPIVWGISATVERFTDAIGEPSGRTRPPDVVVDPVRVRESGLLKDTVTLEVPAESGNLDTVLLRRGAEKLRDITAAWDAYTTEQGLDPIVPLLVLQVANTPKHDEVGLALTTIFDAFPELTADAVAHVFGDHRTLAFGPFQVPYVAPEFVQDRAWVRVLIAKDAISTGWDCPRAEVMVSFRRAKDRTHITQLLGRLIRTPRARQVPGNDRLNSVDCILPFFDARTVQSVVAGLTGDDGDDTPMVARVLVGPVPVTPNPAIDDEVWAKLLSLPSQTLPQRAARPTKRLTALAHAFAADGIIPDAGKKAHSELHLALDAFRARRRDAIAAARADVLTVEGKTVIASLRGGDPTFDDFVEAADLKVIEDAYRRAARLLSADVARTYAERLADQDDEADDIEEALVEAHTDIAAIGLLPEVQDHLDSEADELARRWLDETRIARKSLNDERRDVYRQIIEMSPEPQAVEIAQPQQWLVPTLERTGEVESALPRFAAHLMADPEGQFPAKVNGWERDVIEAETARPGFLGWYRNPSRSTVDSFAVAYRDGERWRTVRPDFIFFARDPAGEVVADLIDPHGAQYADALPKLRGLADYTAEYGSHFRRIEAIAKVGDVYRVLDLTEQRVRDAIAASDDAKALYAGPAAADY